MKKYLIALGLTLAPAVGFAASTGLRESTAGLAGIVDNLTAAANALIPFFLAIAVVVFIYGVIRYILAGGGDEKTSARGYIIWGIIGIAVIVSLFGVIRLLQSTLGVDPNAGVGIPYFRPQ